MESGVSIEVDPKTVGQYIGVKDRNNEEIYSDDIIWIKEKGLSFEEGEIVYVFYSLRYFCFELSDLEHDNEESIGNYIREGFKNNLEVIGNIHDNKNLLTK